VSIRDHVVELERLSWDVHHRLLRIAVAVRGTWPAPQELIEEAGLLGATTWTHSQVDGRLNETRAVEAVRGSLLQGSAVGMPYTKSR
jgi:hypothetical protein